MSVRHRERWRLQIGLTEIGRLKLTETGPNPKGKLAPSFLFAEAFGERTPLVAGRYIGEVLNRIAQAVINDVFGQRFAPYFGVPTWTETVNQMRQDPSTEYPL
jgi:hypothetical protein